MSGEALKVLLVEDNPGDARLVEEYLRGATASRFTIETEERLDAALARLEKGPFGLILIDLNLPDSSGLETFERVQADNPNVPIVILTGVTDEELALEAVRRGAQDYLVKGLGRAEILPRVLLYAVERERVQKILRDSEQRFRDLVESTPDWVWETDENAVYTYSSPKVVDLLGYRPDEIVGRHPFDLMTPENAGTMRAALRPHLDSRQPFSNLEKACLHKNGRTVVLETSGVPVFWSDGKFRGYRGIDRDISQKREAERHLQRAERMNALGNLASGIVHHFNNLLLPMIALTGMTLKSLPEGSRDRERIAKVIEAGHRAKELIDHIARFAKEEEAEPANIDICAVIADTLAFLRSTLPTTIKITESLDKETGVVFADRAQVSSVLINLAGNAADAIEGRTGTISISLAPVDVDAETMRAIINLRPGPYARLRVADDGQGMDAETLARVMDPFFTTKPVGQGTGLGLSMVHGIVSKHGGAIDIESTPGEGTTVDVYLPLVEEDSKTRRKRGREPGRTGPRRQRVDAGNTERLNKWNRLDPLQKSGETLLTDL